MSRDNPLIDLLRSYGPSAASDALCDEHVQAAVERHGVYPIEVPAPRAAELREALLCDDPVSVVLTGTAGDGKTYHIRKFFHDDLGGDSRDWLGEGVVEARLPSGRTLKIIRDLSEIPDRKKDAEVARITSAFLGEETDSVYLMAANNGQLLKMWRDAAEKGGEGAERYAEVHRRLASILHQDLDRDDDLRLRFYNLSRGSAGDTFDLLLDAVLGHADWRRCDGCPASPGSEGGTCPVRLNREILAGCGNRPATFRSRLRDSLRIAASNDQHVPVRQVLTLIVNVLLGDQSNGASASLPLLTCRKSRRRAEAGSFVDSNPYDNALGLNLRPSYRERYGVFSVLEALGIGQETNNALDGLLIDRLPETAYETVFGIDLEHGRKAFEPMRKDYVTGGLGFGPQQFEKALATQRRRLFFLLEDSGRAEALSPWNLTVFHHAGRFISFVEDLAAGRAVDEVSRQVVKGLNRSLTGMMTEDAEQVWLARSIGRSESGAGRLTTVPPIARKGIGVASMRIAYDRRTDRPRIEVRLPIGGAGVEHPSLDLTPLLFEYLMRVADGSLPSSFSRQCHQEVRHFAMNATDFVSRVFQPDPGEGVSQVNLLSVQSDGQVHARAIEV